MGCTCSRDDAKNYIKQELKKRNNPYIIKINIPRTDKIKLIIFEGSSDEMLMTEVINSVFFSKEYSNEIDANFITFYNPEKNEFNYYIQRLIGYEIDDNIINNEKFWIVYINKLKYDWSFLCNKNRILRKNDEIEFRFEKI